MYREISRQWIACLQAGRPECDYEHPAIRNMTRFLLKTPEHTWGNPGRYSLPGCGGSTIAHPHLPCWWDDYRNLSSADGEALLNTQPYRHAAASYAEQRFMSRYLVRIWSFGHAEARARLRRIVPLGCMRWLQAPRVPAQASLLRCRLRRSPRAAVKPRHAR